MIQWILNFCVAGYEPQYLLNIILIYFDIFCAAAVGVAFVIGMIITIAKCDAEDGLGIRLVAFAYAAVPACNCSIGCADFEHMNLVRCVGSQIIWALLSFILNVLIMIFYNDEITHDTDFHLLLKMNLMIQIIYLCLQVPYYFCLSLDLRSIISAFISWIYIWFMVGIFSMEFLGFVMFIVQEFVITHNYEYHRYYQVIWYIYAVFTVLTPSTLVFQRYLKTCVPTKYMTEKFGGDVSIISWCIHDNLFYDKDTKENEILDRIYWILHVSFHYYRPHQLLDKSVNINSNNYSFSGYVPITASHDPPELSYNVDAMTQHQIYDKKCLKYQTQFLSISDIESKVNYLKRIVPYQSWLKYFGCCNEYHFYFYVISKILMNLFVLFWFGYVYLYEIYGKELNKYWIVNERKHDHFEHVFITTLMFMYIIAIVIICICLYDLIGCEYYYGFIRLILMRKQLLNRLVTYYMSIALSYNVFKTNQSIVECLCYVGFPQDIAIIIVLYI